MLTVTISFVTNPVFETDATLTVAPVVASYTLSDAVIPEIVKAFLFTVKVPAV